MKIICSSCRKVLGIQRPYNDDSEVPAKCPDCFQKEKDEASKQPTLPVPGERKDITLESGLKGFLTVADVDTVKLSFWDLIVSGKKIFCAKDRRESFQEYLEMRDSDHVDVTFLYSSSIKIPPTSRRGKKQLIKKDKPQSNNYNCTMTVSKNYALMMFDKVAERQEQFVNVVSEGIVKASEAESPW
ncbi:MAG: hypothetical protein P9M06_02215 [Candidatus Saelkia tenebricola]|nr:hypothetical protein [Candidatus Saelkia tenebricola]